MNYKLLLVLVLISNSLGLHAQVQIFTDDFNDNSRDPAKWGADFDAFGAGGQLTEADGRLEFDLATQTSGGRVRPWIGASPTYGQDWEVIVEVNNTHTYQTLISGGSSIGLAVQNSVNQSHLVYIDFYTENFSTNAKGFYTEMITNNGFSAGSVSNLTSSSSGALRLTFDSASKVISSFHSVGGAWTPLGSFGIAGGGGTTANGNWGMNSDSPFRIGILGNAYGGAAPGAAISFNVPADTHYADNFQLAINTQDSSQSNPTATSRVSEGRAALAARDLATARAKFEQALALDMNHEAANLLMAITRLLDLPNQPTVQAFLDRLGVSAMGRDIYAWSAGPAREPNGDLTIPTGLNGMEFTRHWRTNAVPEISAALANLAKVTSQNFLISLTASETTFEAVDIDLGDILIIRAGLHAVEYFSYTFLAHDFNAQVAAVETFAQMQPFNVAQFLIDYPQLLTFATTNDIAAGRTAFANAADRYAEGSQFLRNRAPGTTRLFNFVQDAGNAEHEQKFREMLADLKTSLDGNVAIRHAGGAFTLFAGALFTGNGPLRSFLPQFQQERIILGTLPDSTFGGFLIGRTADEVEEFVFTERDLGVTGLGTVPTITGVNPAGSPDVTINDVDLREAGLTAHPAIHATSGLPLAFDSHSIFQHTINVPHSVMVADVNVYFYIRHKWVNDLTIDLRSPGGTTVRLVNRRGSGQNFGIGSTTGAMTQMNDQSSSPIGSGFAPFTGSYTPSESLAAFNGESSMGDWTLSIRDNVGDHTGQLVNWAIRVRGSAGNVEPMTPIIAPIGFTARTKIGEGYTVQGSDDFISWSDVGAFVAIGVHTSMTISQSSSTHRFYRLLDVGRHVLRPSNDDFANRINLGTGAVNIMGYNQNSFFSEFGEPNYGFNRAGRTVWYEWTPASSGTYRIKVNAHDSPHPIYAVCTGSGLGSLSVQVDGFPSESGQTFSATAGTTYFIVVDGVSFFGPPVFHTGGFRLSISPE